MRVRVDAPGDALVPGEPVELAVDVTNGLSVIDGVRVTLDNPTGLQWTAAPELLPLFPDGTGTVTVTVTAPFSLAAGAYQVPMHIHSTASPTASTVRYLPLQVRPAPSLSLSVAPSDRVAKHRTSYDLVCQNTGNMALEVDLSATDPSRGLHFGVEPSALTVAPGAEAHATLTASCRRKVLGTEVAHRAQVVATAAEAHAETGITFRQRPLIPRGARTAILLAAIIGVWAAVMVLALSHALDSSPPQKVVPASFYAPNKTGPDPPPAGAVPKSGLDVAAGGALDGVVDAASTGSGVGRITVQAYAVESNGRAVLQASTATATDGTWAIPGLLPGPYRIEISAQGFRTEWYPSAPSESGATTVQVQGLTKTGGLRSLVTGIPGTITGTVVTGESPPPTVTVTVTPVQGSTRKPVAAITTTSTGSYAVTNVPTPNTYNLSFTAPGYQPGSDTEVLTGGEQDIAASLTLTAQAGSISGTVSGGGGPLGGVTVTASANGHTYKTASPTSGAIGTFTLGSLPSPATYLLTFSTPGYGTDTIAQQLGPGQVLTGLSVTLSGGAGDISGKVEAEGGTALGGVAVTVTGTSKPLATETLTAGQVGSYELAGLSTPGQYTLTFSLAGYTSVTVPVDLGSGASASGVDATLLPANGSIDGTVDASGVGAAGVTVTVTDGGPPLTTVSTTDPAGSFSLSGVAAGTYSVSASLPGYASETVEVQVVAGQSASATIDLVPSGRLTVRVDISPRHVTAPPGQPVTLTVTVTNNGAVISGHEIRVLGLDPAWSKVTGGMLSLFPSTSGTASIVVSLPAGIPSGRRTLLVEVRELTEPGEVSTVPVELSVPAETKLSAALEPSSITAGKSARVAVVLSNAGTAEAEVPLEGKDDTGAITFAFDPAAPTLGPGERVTVSARLSARRPLAGSPKIRPFRVEAGTAEAPVVAQGAWVQPPRFSRGALALLGLLVAGTIFAAVLSATLSQVVSQSNSDRALALQVAQADRAQPATGTASIAGVVTLLTTAKPGSGVTVDLYKKGSTGSPIASTATNPSGGYVLSGLPAGSYELSYVGAGFSELWYPDAISSAQAKAVTLTSTQALTGVDIAIGGLPASVSGQVTGPGVAGAVLTVQLPTGAPVVSSSSTAAATSASPASPASPASSTGGGAVGGESAGGTVVTSVTLSASGTFDLTGIPSPATYQLVVIASGDAPAVQEVTLGGGQDRSGISIVLTPGNGAIGGTVSSSSGPVGGATVTATSGSTTDTTVSVTTPGSVGTFSLSSLPSPATISLTVTASGYASQSLSVSLTANQHLTGLAVDLLPGEGSISGTVTTPAGTPSGGVTVSATNGTTTLTTSTSSVDPVGSYSLTGLSVPGTYTVTFSRSDLESQTVDLVLSAGSPNLAEEDESLSASTARLSGIVVGTSGSGLGNVTVTLVSGTTSYEVTTATSPTPGAYTIEGITPGTYTLNFSQQGGVPVSSIVTVDAGQQLTQSPTLSSPASITGLVEDATTGEPLSGAQVTLYLASGYPADVAATTTTNSDGDFTFSGVDAPEDYLVAVAYPAGSSAQVTVGVTTSEGTSTTVCGGTASGSSSASGSSGGTCSSATKPIKVTP